MISRRGRPYANALVQAKSQLPTTGRFGHSVQTATLPAGRDRILGEIAATAWPPQQHPGPFAKQQHGAAGTVP
jgi:hypothetical protein